VEEESSIASSMLSVKSAHLWTFQGVSLHHKNILVFYVCEIRSFDTVPLWGLFFCDSNQKEILLRFVLVNQRRFFECFDCSQVFILHCQLAPLWGMLFAMCNRISFCVLKVHNVYVPLWGLSSVGCRQKEILFQCITC